MSKTSRCSRGCCGMKAVSFHASQRARRWRTSPAATAFMLSVLLCARPRAHIQLYRTHALYWHISLAYFCGSAAQADVRNASRSFEALESHEAHDDSRGRRSEHRHKHRKEYKSSQVKAYSANWRELCFILCSDNCTIEETYLSKMHLLGSCKTKHKHVARSRGSL